MGKVIKNLQFAVYFRTFGNLLQRGVPMVDALRISVDTLTNTALRKDEAEGGVAVFSQDQVATGDRAVYDRTTDIVTMTGNVTLSKGKNVTRGQRLVFNVGTGVATMAAGAGGRVSSSFAPSEEPAPVKNKKP